MIRWLLPLLVFLYGLVLTQPLSAQIQIQFQRRAIPMQVIAPGAFGSRVVPQPELTPPQIELIPSTTAGQLEQVGALITAKQWDEAIDTLIDLSGEQEAGLVEISPNRFIPLRKTCQIKLAQLPSDALQQYRQRVDHVAETWYREAIENQDRERGRGQLERLLREMFCSSWGDDALWALGEMELEAGDFSSARQHWEQISALLRSPAGRPEWIALADIDLDAHWTEVDRHWQQRSYQQQRSVPDWLAFPDTDIHLAEVRARLILVSIREGNYERAEQGLSILRRRYPTAEGRLAGRTQHLVPALEKLLEEARHWPTSFDHNNWSTLGGSLSRDGGLRSAPKRLLPAWQEPFPFYSGAAAVSRNFEKENGQPKSETKTLPLRYHPLIVDGKVLFNGSRQIKVLDLATGLPVFAKDGILYTAARKRQAAGRMAARQVTSRQVTGGTALYTMTEHNGVIYARVGSSVTYRSSRAGMPPLVADQALIGLDLRREGLLTFRVEPDDGSWAFEGAPVCVGNQLFVAMRHSDVKPQACVACFDLNTGERLWRMAVCSADTRATFRGDEITHGMLTLAGETLFYNTNLGAVAALSSGDGTIRWLARYKRDRNQPAPLPQQPAREISPCVYSSGIVFVAPSDSRQVLAIDAHTGAFLWASDQAVDADHLLGIAGGNLIAAGHRLFGFDMQTGKVNFVWPASTKAGIRGRGRGCLAGDEIFWPTRERIFVIRARNGAQTRAPLELRGYSSDGANVVVADGHLLLATPERLMAFGPHAPSEKQQQPKSAQQTVAVAEWP